MSSPSHPDDIEALKALLLQRDGELQHLRNTVSTLEKALNIRTRFNSSIDETALRAHFEKVLPGLKRFIAADRRAVVIGKYLSLNEAVKHAKQLLDMINAQILVHLAILWVIAIRERAGLAKNILRHSSGAASRLRGNDGLFVQGYLALTHKIPR